MEDIAKWGFEGTREGPEGDTGGVREGNERVRGTKDLLIKLFKVRCVNNDANEGGSSRAVSIDPGATENENMERNLNTFRASKGKYVQLESKSSYETPNAISVPGEVMRY